jgi:hypothetical protein
MIMLRQRTNYRQLSLHKTERVKKKVISKKLLGFVLVERRLAVQFVRQRQNLTYVGEHGAWSQRATADRNRS